MKRISLYVVALLCSLSAVGATTFDFSSSIPAGWTASVAPKGYEAERGTQFLGSNTLTLSGVSNVTEVTIVASSNTPTTSSYKLSVAVSGTALGSTVEVPKTTNTPYTFSGGPADGDLVVSIECTGQKSLWIKSITVEGNVPEPENPADRLDKDYVYNEPEMILPVEELGKMAFDTVINNILLTCAQGAFYKTDIRVMANAALTLTATKPIKAIRVDGGVRKSFSAETNAGELSYYSSDEGDIEGAAPVLLIKNIDSATVTRTCFAQRRMEKLYVYFEANPDVEIEMDEDPEPLTACTVTSSTGEWNFVTSYVDPEYLWTIGTTKIHLVSNPEWQLYTDGYIYGDGSGVYLELDFYPDDILYDWSGTYTKESGKLTDYCYAYQYFIGDGEDDDVWEGFYFVDGSSITLTANEDTYDLEYSLIDTYGETHSGTVKGICKEAAQPMAIENIEVGLDTQAPMFNILGQPIDGSYRGIIIQNNRKYLLLP